MENNENYGVNQEPREEIPVAPETMPEQEIPAAPVFVDVPEPEVPVQTPGKPKWGRKVLKAMASGAVIVALVAASCAVTGLIVGASWRAHFQLTNQRLDNIIQALNNEIDDLREEMKEYSFTGNGNSVSGTPNTPAVGSGLTPGQVYAQNVNAVVAISNQATMNIYGQITETASSGSGFIITENGYVVTNYHVVEGATKLTVMLHNGEEYDAKLVGYDSANDMAVLKVEATGLPFVKLGKSEDLIVGDQVVAIGNPLGELTNSLTVGYVSAIERSIKTGGALINMIQADVAINSGNSGGPLFNMKGEVVGITTAKYSGTSGSGATIEGISFAIPVDDVVKKINDLVNYGYITGAYLGVSVSDTDPTYAEYFGIPAGAYVRDVTKGYCAYEAGIKAKDVIVELGGYKITCLNDLSKALDHFNAGDTIIVVVYRGGGKINIELTLDERPQMTNSDVTPAP